MRGTWCEEDYTGSVTSRAWSATPLDARWDSPPFREEVSSSRELSVIFEEEMALDPVPSWAAEIVDRMIGPLPMCGHYTFPSPILEVCEAISTERCPSVAHGCYTADPQRKRLMSYIVYCLDAWLGSAPLHVAVAELGARSDPGRDWSAIAAAVYLALGARSETKALLVERLIHRLRWWIKVLIWDGDSRHRFQLDVYAGDVRGDESKWGAYGNSPYGDPYFAELRVPRVLDVTQQIIETAPEGTRLLELIESTWLCAPKAFRYVEKIILYIGAIDRPHGSASGVSVLQCEDTYPELRSCRRWFQAFIRSISEYLAGEPGDSIGLVEPTAPKLWLARILRYKLQLYEKHDNMGLLVGNRSGGKGGTRVV